MSATEEEVEAMIQRIQHFDPPGVAARDLQECLLLQLQRQKDEGKDVDMPCWLLKNISMNSPKSIMKKFSAD